ncbi:hypothetical protein A4G99_19230 [Haladaptatus sp. R4]|uniref:ABC transporter substrate-binding protein n=1 Tax=Haladaptatus sp. R4 TaxID=1679489 RepID=UPI0007B4DF64|nr:ABC transporter substrate-binding protein [Haladaptatus sp. R4]KZN22597.1 hypothetical protein A4G99_19230 [Haladaptatus sp. R4]
MAALAGCSGGDGNNTKGNSSGGGSNDDTFDTFTWTIPTNAQFNPYASKNWDDKIRNLIFDPLAQYNHKTGKYKGYIVSDWSIDGSTLTLKIRDGYTWHNGDPVTADDLITQFQIEKFFENPIWDYFNSVEATDDHTVKAKVKKVSPKIIYAELFNQSRYVQAPKSRFGKWLKKLQNGGDSALQNFLKYTPNDPLGNGPMKISDKNQQRYLLEWHDDYPLADKPNFSNWQVNVEQSNQAKWAAIKGGECDALETYMPESVLKTLPKAVKMQTIPDYGGACLALNHDHKHLGRTAVRKAIAYVLPRPQVSKTIYGPVGTPVKYITGVTAKTNQSVLGDSIDQFERYEQSTDKAAKVLQNAGYTKNSGTWKKDGSPLGFTISVSSATSNHVSGYKAAASILSDFGMNAKVETVSDSAYWGDIYPNSKFDAAQNYWGARVPYNSERPEFVGGEGSTAEAINIPDEFKVPSKFGDPDSKKESVTPAKLLSSLKTAQNDSEIKSRTKKIAWVFNQTLPQLTIVEKKRQIFYTTDDWKYPAKNSAAMHQGSYNLIPMLLRSGDIQAKK